MNSFSSEIILRILKQGENKFSGFSLGNYVPNKQLLFLLFGSVSQHNQDDGFV
jgi:hypothetical protein